MIINLENPSELNELMGKILFNLFDYLEINKIKGICTNIDSESFFETCFQLINRSMKPKDEERILNLMYDNFISIRGFHATKQVDIEKVFDEGLVLFDRNDYYNFGLELFEDFKDKNEIFKIVDRFTERIDNMKINFSANSEFDQFHYLIYGSETLLSIANSINNIKCLEKLRNRGIPVIYCCNIPIKYVDRNDTLSLFKVLMLNYFISLSENSDDYERRFNFTLNTDRLNSDYIISYKIADFKMLDLHDYGEYYYDVVKQKNTHKKN